jgi:hypothetical protein
VTGAEGGRLDRTGWCDRCSRSSLLRLEHEAPVVLPCNLGDATYFGVPPAAGQSRGRAAQACFVKCFTDRCTPARYGGEPMVPHVGVNLCAHSDCRSSRDRRNFSGDAMVCSCRAQQHRDGRWTGRRAIQLLLVRIGSSLECNDTPRDRSISAVRAPLKADCNDCHCN